MIAMRVIGILLALGGMLAFLIGILGGNSGAQSDALTLALFAMIAGLIVALGADAGQKLERRSLEAKTKKSAPPTKPDKK